MRHRGVIVGLTLIAALVWTPVQEAVAEQSRVRLITTGGTISNRPGGRLSAVELLASVPDLEDLLEAEPEEFANIPSSALTLDQWLQLARRINQVFQTDPALAGIVVTSGTDTLEELAYFLHLTVRHARPVVVVGAMRRPGALGTTAQRTFGKRCESLATPSRPDAVSLSSSTMRLIPHVRSPRPTRCTSKRSNLVTTVP
jgi:L-asparaginase/Glu-tRNA(Gln) amidotransferase subunit D